MGLCKEVWELMLQELPRGQMLSFGYPDVLFEDPTIAPSQFGEQIAQTHGYRASSPDTKLLFQSKGWSMLAVDVLPTRGVEVALDLNYPLPSFLENRFDAVLDLGTGEHVFNIGQVFVNALHAARVGGVIFHEHPLGMCNHGFWNVQPTAVLDFYEQNGCEVRAWVRTDGVRGMVAAHRRRFGAPDKTTIITVAVKKEEVKTKWPTQSRYLNNGVG